MKTDCKIPVCFVSFKAYPLFNPNVKATFGGAEVDFYLLATELAKDSQYDVRFIVGDYGQPDDEYFANVHLIKSVDVYKNLFTQTPTLWRSLKKADADIYLHEACSLVTTVTAVFCHFHKRGFVYRTASTRETDGTYFRQYPLRAPLVKWAFRKADFLIVQNQQDAAAALKNVGKQSIMIRNGCRISSQTPDSKTDILWVGRSMQVKRPDLFLQLVKEFPDKKFTMICHQGSGDTQYDKIIQQATSLENLTFLERVPFQKIDTYFENASVLVNTSDSEGFPNTFVQACKSKTAILSLNVNPDQFLTRHHCGLSAEGNWQQFTQMLKQLTESSNADELGSKGFEYIQQNHDLEKIIKTYKELFWQIHKTGR